MVVQAGTCIEISAQSEVSACWALGLNDITSQQPSSHQSRESSERRSTVISSLHRAVSTLLLFDSSDCRYEKCFGLIQAHAHQASSFVGVANDSSSSLWRSLAPMNRQKKCPCRCRGSVQFFKRNSAVLKGDFCQSNFLILSNALPMSLTTSAS